MRAHRVVPRLLMVAGLTLPVAATVEFLSHFGLRELATAQSLSTPPPRARTPNPPPNSGKPTPSPNSGTPTPFPNSGAATPRPNSGTPTPTPNSGAATPPPSSHANTSGIFTGPVVQGFFGPVQAQINVVGGKIMNVNITAPKDNPTSQYINSIAVPMLRSETLQAQSGNINVISGATVTSDTYYQSLVSALKNAHL
jgi:uncharacterized protein with FMN-binding domain